MRGSRGFRLVAVLGLSLVAGCGVVALPQAVSSPTSVGPSSRPRPIRAATPNLPAEEVAPSPSPAAQQSPEEQYLLHNKLYSAGKIPAVKCPLPTSALSSRPAILRYANAVVGCLQRAWAPLVQRTGESFVPAVVYAVGPGSKTACGVFGGDYVAFYCRTGWGIYFDWDNYVEDGPGDRANVAAAIQFTMAHEFGHHVQQLVFISTYFNSRWDQATGAAQVQETRRHELQASCFADAFFGANQKTLGLYGEKLADFRWHAYAGDDDDPSASREYGSRKTNTTWAKAAFKAKSPAACNTWTASAGKVS